MQKLFVVLPIALTVAACGSVNRPSSAAAPKEGSIAYEVSGIISQTGTARDASAPPVVVRSPESIGEFVRARSAQMNFCYEEALKGNPKLAGALALAVTITSGGDVTDASITKRSVSGKGSQQLEECVRARVKTWKFPSSDAPTGTYPFSVSFTK
jgi:hypothetical protein